MRFIDRATRTKEARNAWAALLVLFLIGLLWARFAQHGVVAEQVRAAEGRAIRYSNTTVSDQVIERGDRIVFAPRQLKAALDASVMTDRTVASIRVWSPDGTLLASTVPGEMPATRLDGEPLLSAALSGVTEAKVVPASTGSSGRAEDVLEVFTPLRVEDRSEPVGAVELDFLYHGVIAAAPSSSAAAKLFSLLALLSGVMLVLSLVLSRRDAATPKLARFTADEPAPLSAVPGRTVAAPEPPRAEDLHKELAAAREQLQRATEAVADLEGQVKEDPASPALLADIETAQARIAELESKLGQVRAETVPQAQEFPQQAFETSNGNGDRPTLNEPQPASQVEPMRDVPSVIADLEAQVAQAEDDVGALRSEESDWDPEEPAEGTALNLSAEADAFRAQLARKASRKKRLGSDRPDDDLR